MTHHTTTVAVFLIVYMLTFAVSADEADLLRDLKAFFETNDDNLRESIVQRIELNPDYKRTDLSRRLNQIELFKPFSAGFVTLRASLENGATRSVMVRVPVQYDPRHAYPLIYALHGQGGNGTEIIRYVERVFDENINQFIVAAPDQYTQVVIQSTTPPSAEHILALNAVRKELHVDSNRVYVLGYSRGGHAAWTLAVSHPAEYAGVAAVAGSLLLQDYGELAEVFLPNLTATHLYACWGQNDVYGPDYRTPTPDGGIAGLNRRICELAGSLQLPVKWYEMPEAGHGNVIPPRKDLDELLAHTRVAYPASICHVFRLVYQGRTAWIEPRDWQGPWWDQQPLKIRFNADENPDNPGVQRAARVRAVRNLLGEVRGDVKDQEIKVYRKRINELAVWIYDGMVDWDQPITLNVNGRKVYEGPIQPDLFVCLSQAARTYDFDRLYWAGLYFKSGSKVRIITGRTSFPPVSVTP